MATLGTTICSSNTEARKHPFIDKPVEKHKGKPLSRVDDGYLRWTHTRMASTFEDRNLQNAGKKISVQALLAELDACSRTRDLQRGKKLHTVAAACGHHSNIYITSALVRMYAKCGSMFDARRMFDSVQKPEALCWNVLLMGYAENGEGLVALDLFSRMKTSSGVAPGSVTYVAALKACMSLAAVGDCRGKRNCLERGRQIHLEIGSNLNRYVQNTLIDMYAKCNIMVEARRMFDSVQKPDVVCWNALLLGYAENGEGLVALDLFSSMKASGCSPSSITYYAALKACTSLAVDGGASGKKNCLERGRAIHSEIGDLRMESTLVDMYVKCGSILDARRVFDNIQKPDVGSWNSLLLGCAENRQGLLALGLFARMKASGCATDSVTYLAAVKACTSCAVNGDASGKRTCLERGREIHSEIGRNLNHYVQNTLIDMYAKCGSMVDARAVFDSIQNPDVVCWNALLLGYTENGEALVALSLFSRMKATGCAPDYVTYVAALKACTSLAVNGDGGGKKNCLELGREIHSQIGSNLSHYVQSTLVGMYAKCGSMLDARYVFDSIQKPDVVSWTALILGYAENGEGLVSLDLFSRMKASGIAPDSVTFVAALKACTSLAVNGDGSGCLERGRQIHSEIGSNLNSYVQNTLINMYAKCGSMVDARCVFNSTQKPDVVRWNALIMGYADNGEGLVALDLFSSMKASESAPSSVTYVAALKACGLIGALRLGRKLHSEITEFTAHIVTSLVDFYGKCGSMVEAHEVFDMHPKARAVATWNAMLGGYSRFGDSDSVFSLFEAMQDKGFQPDAVTFVYMLSCCSHAGLVEKAREYFKGMDLRYGVTPTVMHYNCMVDVLGRANLLNEAVGLLQRMPCNPDVITWMALLGACRKWKNVEVGKTAFQSLMAKDEKGASAYVLMAHIYGSKGMRLEQEKVLETGTKIGN